MIISRNEIKISTTNAVISLILGISAIFWIFYGAKADAVDRINDVSQRVTTVEANDKRYDSDITAIKEAVAEVPTLVKMVKRAYPNY